MQKIITYICVGVIVSVFWGCASTTPRTPVYEVTDDKYTSAFPARNVSGQLSNIQNSVQRIISTVTYQLYNIAKERVMLSDITSQNIETLSLNSTKTSQSNAGTAISILENESYTIFITANHVIQSADTVVTYRRGIGIPDETFIKSIAIKTQQRAYLFNYGLLIELEFMAADRLDDLALLAADNRNYDFDAPPLRIQTGTAKNLQLGSFIYVMGFPLGRPMVTRGIVSAPDYDNQGGFLTDALFNHGVSGGLIIASNDNYDSFEWVGMSSTASVKKEHFLVPDPNTRLSYNDFDMYTDSVYFDQKSFINYGISRAIPIEDVLEFLYSNEEKLNQLGLSATDLAGQ